MKNLLAAIVISVAFTACKNEAPTTEEAHHLAWCDEIYHQNVGCPKRGQVVIPPKVLAEQEASLLAWCDRTYHQNVGCPKHGKVVIPPKVLAEQEAHHLAWCDQIGHRNVGCPNFGD